MELKELQDRVRDLAVSHAAKPFAAADATLAPSASDGLAADTTLAAVCAASAKPSHAEGANVASAAAHGLATRVTSRSRTQHIKLKGFIAGGKASRSFTTHGHPISGFEGYGDLSTVNKISRVTWSL